jgi:hypothetical protein
MYEMTLVFNYILPDRSELRVKQSKTHLAYLTPNIYVSRSFET